MPQKKFHVLIMKFRQIFTGLVSAPPLVESEVLKTGVTIV
jgi:hypothetical protein